MKQEAVETAVSCWHHVADLHLFAQWTQLEPKLLSVAIEVHILVHLSVELEVLLLHGLLVVLVDDLTTAFVVLNPL